jgi:hypothetical protein
MHNVLDACISITKASGRGLGPEILEFFGPLKWQRAKRVPFGPKKVEFLELNLLPLAQVIDLPTSKTLYRAILTIYAPMIYTAPCIMFWMRAYPLLGQVEGGWALELESFLGHVKWHRADRRVPFGTQKSRDFQGSTPSHLPLDLLAPKALRMGPYKS